MLLLFKFPLLHSCTFFRSLAGCLSASFARSQYQCCQQVRAVLSFAICLALRLPISVVANCHFSVHLSFNCLYRSVFVDKIFVFLSFVSILTILTLKGMATLPWCWRPRVPGSLWWRGSCKRRGLTWIRLVWYWIRLVWYWILDKVGVILDKVGMILDIG